MPVPEIHVEDEDMSDLPTQPSPIGISDAMRATGVDTTPMSPTAGMTARYRSNSILASPVQSPRTMSPSAAPHHDRAGSDVSGDWQLSAGPSRTASMQPRGSVDGRERGDSNVSAQDVLEVLDNSAWGESIRRSFTMRRPSSGRPL